MKWYLLILLELFVVRYTFSESKVSINGNENIYPVKEFQKIEKSEGLLFYKNDPDPEKSTLYKLTIINSRSNSDFVLEFVDFRIDDIEIYIPNPSLDSYRRYRTGDYFLFNTRQLDHKNFVFLLPQIYGTPYDLFFKTKSYSKSGFEIKANIRSFSNFASYGFAEYGLLLFFYGILFCMGMYNLVRYFFTKELTHLAYVLYILALAFFSLSRIDGLGFQYVWPNFPSFNQYSFQVSLALFVLLSTIFAALFLDIKNRKPVLFNVILIWMSIRIAFTVFIVVKEELIDLKVYDLLWMSMLLAFHSKLNSNVKMFTKLFLGAYACMLLGFLMYTLQDLNIIKHSLTVYYTLNFGVLTETFLLSMAISEKTRLLMVDKQNAQREVIVQLRQNEILQVQLVEELSEKEIIKDKINRELEEKVQGRTEELKDKNKLLQEQKVEIENLASQIDKQYYYLQKETNTNKVNYLWTKRFSYSHFSELFPDEITCLVYMEKLKWPQNDFSCTKCNHTNFIRNPSNLSRKCSKCTHIESVTANTLFHGLRFPLQKAFYITYCCIHGLDGTTLTNLSSNIDLRMNTCSQFAAKVKEKMALLKDSGKSGDVVMQSILVNYHA